MFNLVLVATLAYTVGVAHTYNDNYNANTYGPELTMANDMPMVYGDHAPQDVYPLLHNDQLFWFTVNTPRQSRNERDDWATQLIQRAQAAHGERRNLPQEPSQHSGQGLFGAIGFDAIEHSGSGLTGSSQIALTSTDRAREARMQSTTVAADGRLVDNEPRPLMPEMPTRAAEMENLRKKQEVDARSEELPERLPKPLFISLPVGKKPVLASSRPSSQVMHHILNAPLHVPSTQHLPSWTNPHRRRLVSTSLVATASANGPLNHVVTTPILIPFQYDPVCPLGFCDKSIKHNEQPASKGLSSSPAQPAVLTGQHLNVAPGENTATDGDKVPSVPV